MNGARFEKLTKRQRECLRGMTDLKSGKEIGADLGISESTVYGHLDAAVKVLGARDRSDAALTFRAFEQATHPQIPTGPSPRLDPEPVTASPTAPPAAPSWVSWLPLRPKGAISNDLSPAARLAWIPMIAILLAIGFGAVVNGLEVLGGIFERLWHLFR